MAIKNLTIVGCGNTGSIFAYLAMYKLLDNQLQIKNINLIDYDILTKNDNPYGLICDSSFENYISFPKVLYLRSVLYQVQYNIPDEVKIIIDAIQTEFTNDLFINTPIEEKHETLYNKTIFFIDNFLISCELC